MPFEFGQTVRIASRLGYFYAPAASFRSATASAAYSDLGTTETIATSDTCNVSDVFAGLLWVRGQELRYPLS